MNICYSDDPGFSSSACLEKERITDADFFTGWTSFQSHSDECCQSTEQAGWLVGWGLTALLTQNRSYRACRFVGIFYSKL